VFAAGLGGILEWLRSIGETRSNLQVSHSRWDQRDSLALSRTSRSAGGAAVFRQFVQVVAENSWEIHSGVAVTEDLWY